MKKTIQLSSVSPLLLMAVIVPLLQLFLLQLPAKAEPLPDKAGLVTAAAMKLVAFCANPKTGLDAQAAAVLVDYVLEAKSYKETALPSIEHTTGAYYEYDIHVGFPNFLHYSYGSKMPLTLLSPSSLRYSTWRDLPGEFQGLPTVWKLPVSAGKPIIIHGLERDCITPDLTTGIYYEYDLKRTLVVLNHKGRAVLLSISRQAAQSDVGRQGFILGSDDDWNYYYSGEPGSARTGLGWIKSYIYNFFSVGVYVESGTSMVRSGLFQWIRAGWSGINFVKTEHVLKGIKRYGRNIKIILESPHLPAPNQIALTYHQLAALPSHELAARYNALQQARQAQAVRMGKIKAGAIKKQDDSGHMAKEEMVEELMLEHLKIALGKSSLLGTKVAAFNTDQTIASSQASLR